MDSLETSQGANDSAGPQFPSPPDSMDAARFRMVAEQIAARGIRRPSVLQACRDVPRHEFVPPALRAQAYFDEPLPIGHDQTISQPYIVALMTEHLELTPDHTVLEIGTGCGYQTAILARLAARVFTIEIVAPLADQARATFQRLNITNVEAKTGDGYQGWPEHAPFDAIVVTCAPHQIPQPLIDQLREQGRMVIPVGGPDRQELVLLAKRHGQITQRAILPVLFVPMTGQSEGTQRI